MKHHVWSIKKTSQKITCVRCGDERWNSNRDCPMPESGRQVSDEKKINELCQEDKVKF